MGKSVLVKVRNNIAILTIICSLAMLFLYIVGYFTTLHPDAYRDLVRSILLGYGIYLAIFSLYNGVYGKLSVRVKGTGSNRVRSKTVGKIKESPSEAICIIFMIITFLNSLMMLTGFDTPKEGTYAYVHMMTRLVIIAGIITIFMWKDVLQRMKNFNFQNIFRNFYNKAYQSIFRFTAKIFTLITVIYCTLIIALQSIIDPDGGLFFYQSLLGILLFVSITMIVFRFSRRA